MSRSRTQTKGDKYYLELKRRGLVGQARIWLKSNPPPKGWRGGQWAWAHTEMPVLF
jgi:hypothetical protein